MVQKKDKKTNSEEPLIDKSGELLKKLIVKGKRQGFLKRDECENIFEEGQFEDKDEFYSKIENLNIQIYENDADDSSTDEEENSVAVKSPAEKESDTGRADDPVRMYLKEMGNVELLSRVGEIEIAKRIESGKKKTIEERQALPLGFQRLLTIGSQLLSSPGWVRGVFHAPPRAGKRASCAARNKGKEWRSNRRANASLAQAGYAGVCG